MAKLIIFLFLCLCFFSLLELGKDLEQVLKILKVTREDQLTQLSKTELCHFLCLSTELPCLWELLSPTTCELDGIKAVCWHRLLGGTEPLGTTLATSHATGFISELSADATWGTRTNFMAMWVSSWKSSTATSIYQTLSLGENKLVSIKKKLKLSKCTCVTVLCTSDRPKLK